MANPFFLTETLTLLDAVSGANTGSSRNFRAGRTVETARYAVTGDANSSNLTATIQVSLDNANWSIAATPAANANCVNTTVTGTISGPIPYVRCVTSGGGVGVVTAKIAGLLKP